MILSDGAPAVLSAAQMAYPRAAHPLCLTSRFCHLETLTPRLAWFERRKFRQDFWCILDAENELQARRLAQPLQSALREAFRNLAVRTTAA